MVKDDMLARREMCLVSKLQRTQISTHSFCEAANGVCKPKPLLDTVGFNTEVLEGLLCDWRLGTSFREIFIV